MAGIGAVALGAVGAAVAPAIAASNRLTLPAAEVRLSDVDAFTPAAADPKLAALFARAGLDTSTFRFTPTQSRRGSTRAVTVAVRARSTNAVTTADRVTMTPEASTVSIAPIAYNLGVAVGWRRFALSGDMARVDLAGRPGSREAVDLGLSYTGRKVGAQVRATADRPLTGGQPPPAEPSSYGVDVGGSYSISRRVDLTAGVRYKSERDRLPQLTGVTGSRRDGQAVYVGTAFRF